MQEICGSADVVEEKERGDGIYKRALARSGVEHAPPASPRAEKHSAMGPREVTSIYARVMLLNREVRTRGVRAVRG